MASVSWSLEVNLPGSFPSFLNLLSVFSLNLSLECYTSQSFFEGVYLSAAAPFALAVLVCVSFFVSKWAGKDADGEVQKLASRLLLLSYMVLPPTVLKLFQVEVDCKC